MTTGAVKAIVMATVTAPVVGNVSMAAARTAHVVIVVTAMVTVEPDCHVTMAGVMASFASVGDLIIAEPGARIGFAGPRVIKDTTQAELPKQVSVGGHQDAATRSTASRAGIPGTMPSALASGLQ